MNIGLTEEIKVNFRGKFIKKTMDLFGNQMFFKDSSVISESINSTLLGFCFLSFGKYRFSPVD